MCKLLLIPNTNGIKNMDKAVKIIADVLTRSERHGFGYAIVGANGTYGERTCDATFDSRIKSQKYAIKAPWVKKTYNHFGKVGNPIGAGLFHSRTSTNTHNLLNTHPMRIDDWYLVHNGVVTNHGEQYKKATQNDSEDVLYHLKTGGIDAVAKNLTGYYAFGAIDPEGNCHVVRDATANLVACFNRTINSYMFATNADILESVAEPMGWKLGPIDNVKDGQYLVFGVDGSVIKHSEFKARGYEYSESRWASKSLGRALVSAPVEKPITTMNNDWYDSYDASIEYDEEIRHMDASYTIETSTGELIQPYEYNKLDEIAKAHCTIIRADGTLVDKDEYFTEKLA